MRDNKWVRLLDYVTGWVNQRLLLQNEYLAAENRILRSHLPSRLRLSDPERSTLAEIGERVGRKDLQLVASVALPDTILAWYCRLIKRPGKGPTSSRLNWVDCVNKGSKSVLIHADIGAQANYAESLADPKLAVGWIRRQEACGHSVAPAGREQLVHGSEKLRMFKLRWNAQGCRQVVVSHPSNIKTRRGYDRVQVFEGTCGFEQSNHQCVFVGGAEVARTSGLIAIVREQRVFQDAPSRPW